MRVCVVYSPAIPVAKKITAMQKKKPMTYAEARASRPSHAIMLTANGEVLVPLPEVPPEKSRFLRTQKIDIRILDKRAFAK